MPRIRKPVHLLSEEALSILTERRDTLIQLHSIEGVSVGMMYKDRKILGFVHLWDYPKETIHVILVGVGRYKDKGYVKEFDLVRRYVCQG